MKIHIFNFNSIFISESELYEYFRIIVYILE